MTSATVTQLNEMFSNIGGSTGSGAMAQNGEFAGVFQTVADKGDSTNVSEMPKKTEVDRNLGGVKTAEKLREKSVNEQAPETRDSVSAEEELEPVVEDLKQEVAERLDMSIEELEAVLEALGMTGASLFTKEGMTALIMEVEQISTPVELLTNADAYQMLQELTEHAADLLGQVQKEMQLSDTQMKDVLTQIAKNADADGSEIKTEVVSEDNVPERTDLNSDNGMDGTMAEDGGVSKETILPQEKEMPSEHRGSEQSSARNEQQTFAENNLFNNTQALNQTNTEFVQNVNGQTVSAQEIYDQIGEYIKTNVRPGVSEVEMQLNPESLGSLHIHLSSKQGNVTAQFVVQNEAVKAALEMQMVQLKENFAEQGIKVESVEVTVESHAFNQNMQQGSNENEQAQASAKRPAIRRINLNGMWEEEDLTEEEQLVAEMMEANGNTVDFMA